MSQYAAMAQAGSATTNVFGKDKTSTGDRVVDLAGQEAVVDRKLEQTGRNAVTQSRAWDILGNIIGFNTHTDYEDAKAGIDAQQDTIQKQQEQAAHDAFLKTMAEKKARNDGVDTLAGGFNDSFKTLTPTSKEDEAHLAGLNLSGNEALEAMRSDDAEIRAAGAKQFEEIEKKKREFALENEKQRIEQQNFQQSEARAKASGDAQLAETIRHNRNIEQLNREQYTSAKETAVRKDFYDQHASKHELVQGVVNDIYVGLKEATSNNNPAALNAAQKKLAKLSDPTTGVLQGEMRDMVASGLGDRLVRAYDRGRGVISQKDAEDIYNAAKALEESERKVYERNLKIAQEKAALQGIAPEVLAPYAYKPLESGADAIAPKDKKDSFKPGDVISGGTEVLLEGAKTVGGVVGSVFGN